MIAVSSGTQQYVTLSRIRGERLRVFQALLRGDRAIQSHHLYVWQMPIMLLSFSIWYLLIGLLILIYARAAASSPWGPDVKVTQIREKRYRLVPFADSSSDCCREWPCYHLRFWELPDRGSHGLSPQCASVLRQTQYFDRPPSSSDQC